MTMDELNSFKNLVISRPEKIIKFLTNLNIKSFNRLLISFRQHGKLNFHYIIEDPENSEEIYFGDFYDRIGKINV